ncbi:MAG: hypothetical protein M1831_005137 [Alyxoria varia]|nr:MAG: hypothetical protein M1831_005137 [Alyxoria varia]
MSRDPLSQANQANTNNPNQHPFGYFPPYYGKQCHYPRLNQDISLPKPTGLPESAGSSPEHMALNSSKLPCGSFDTFHHHRHEPCLHEDCASSCADERTPPTDFTYLNAYQQGPPNISHPYHCGPMHGQMVQHAPQQYTIHPVPTANAAHSGGGFAQEPFQWSKSGPYSSAEPLRSMVFALPSGQDDQDFAQFTNPQPFASQHSNHRSLRQPPWQRQDHKRETIESASPKSHPQDSSAMSVDINLTSQYPIDSTQTSTMHSSCSPLRPTSESRYPPHPALTPPSPIGSMPSADHPYAFRDIPLPTDTYPTPETTNDSPSSSLGPGHPSQQRTTELPRRRRRLMPLTGSTSPKCKESNCNNGVPRPGLFCPIHFSIGNHGRTPSGNPLKPADDFLLRARAAGYSYAEIQEQGGFKEELATLRGRHRKLTKRREERVRKPIWTKKDMDLLLYAVPLLASSTPRAARTGKNPWAKIADWMFDNGGTYRFGCTTCKRKWDELQRGIRAARGSNVGTGSAVGSTTMR